jgi:Trk-type K+ transport system membrane component
MKLLLLGLYGAGYLKAWVQILKFQIEEEMDIYASSARVNYRPDKLDLVFYAIISTLSSLFWPLILIGVVLWKLISPAIETWIDSKWSNKR